jgi:hypothetical protein
MIFQTTGTKIWHLSSHYVPPKDIFKMDETTLFYTVQQKMTLAVKKEKCKGRKENKNILMVLLRYTMYCRQHWRISLDDYENIWKPHCLKDLKMHDSAAGIVTGYGLGDGGLWARPEQNQECWRLHIIQTGSGAHPAIYPVDTKGSFPHR